MNRWCVQVCTAVPFSYITGLICLIMENRTAMGWKVVPRTTIEMRQKCTWWISSTRPQKTLALCRGCPCPGRTGTHHMVYKAAPLNRQDWCNILSSFPRYKVLNRSWSFNTRRVERSRMFPTKRVGGYSLLMCSRKENPPRKHGRGEWTLPHLRPLGEQWSVLLLEQVEQLVLLVLGHHLAHCLIVLLLLLQRLGVTQDPTPSVRWSAHLLLQAMSFSNIVTHFWVDGYSTREDYRQVIN